MTECCTHSKNDLTSCSCCSPLPHMMTANLKRPRVYGTASDGSVNPPSLIISSSRGGHIQTLAGGNNHPVEAIGISHGVVRITGSLADVKAAMPDAADIRYLKDEQTLLPGFIEPHLHIIPTSVFNCWLDLSPFDGQYLRTTVAYRDNKPEQIYNRDWIKKTLDENLPSDKSEWLLGTGIDPALFEGGSREINAQVLNRYPNPVFLINASMHLAYVNKPALERLKAIRSSLSSAEQATADLVLANNGIVREMAQMSLFFKADMVPLPAADQVATETRKMLEAASSRGVTYMFDAGIEPASEGVAFDQVDYLRQTAMHAECPVRIGGALVLTSLTQLNTQFSQQYTPGMGDSRFHLPFIKLVSDGSNQGLTGYQYTPYECDDDYRLFSDTDPQDYARLATQSNTGMFNYGYPLELDALIAQSAEAGWSLMVHANGDHAIDRTIDAFEKAAIERQPGYRDRIEHCSLLTDRNIERMQQLGLSPSFLIGHVGYWGWAFQQTILGEARAATLDRCRSALSGGLRISLHSDNAVSPLGPLRMMEQAVTRVMEDAPQGMETAVLNADETLTRFQALKAMTWDAAWHCHADQWAGSLEPGKCADFVILEQSPLTYRSANGVYSAEGMRDIPVQETWKGGVKYHPQPAPARNSPMSMQAEAAEVS